MLPTSAAYKPVTASIETIRARLVSQGLLAHDHAKITSLPGGVSSAIFIIDDGRRKLVVKQALARLKVKDDWRVGTNRSRNEHRFITHLNALAPEHAPKLVLTNDSDNYFVMEYLNGFVDWKAQLLAGHANPAYAGKAGELLGAIHRYSWHNLELGEEFDTTEYFHALRTEPYLLTTAARHPSLAPQIHREAQRLDHTRLCMVHGDFSPKNLMVRGDDLVLIDCEVAWFGDPAFDLAFLFNHFLLKSLYHHAQPIPFINLVDDVWRAYRGCFDHKDYNLETRVARLLLMLLLARIDGKSPVEYINLENQKQLARDFVYQYLLRQTFNLNELCERWRECLLTLNHERPDEH